VTESAAPRPPALDPASVRGIIFDLDGTLIDSYSAIAASLNHARRHFGLSDLGEDEVRAQVGRGLESLLTDTVGADRVERGVELFRERYARLFATGTQALPGVAETLARLRQRGFGMAVASNKPARFGEPILRELGLLGFFRSVQGPDRAGSTKPDPAMIRHCLSDLDVDAASALYVGDMILDVETAACAGVPVVLVAGGSSSQSCLAATGQPVLASLGQLPRLLAPARAGGTSC